ncbi:MAG: FAD:protein FMN transferase [Minisyncoccia bacterium]
MPYVYTYSALGTSWTIQIWDSLSENEYENLSASLCAITQKFEDTYSRFKRDSLMWQLTSRRGIVEVPKDFVQILRWYIRVYPLTRKKITPLIGFALCDAGYDASYETKDTFTEKEQKRTIPDLTIAVSIIDDTHIILSESVLFDFGAIGKGYLVDKCAAFLKEEGVNRYLVEGGGDIFYEGAGVPITVGLEHPEDATKLIGTVELTQGSVCGSSIRKRVWGKHSHYVDPDTHVSPNSIVALWVVGSSATLADAVSSSLFFSEPKDIVGIPFEYCIIHDDMKVDVSLGFKANLFS